MKDKLAMIGNKHFIKQTRHFSPTWQRLISSTLGCVRPVSLVDIGGIWAPDRDPSLSGVLNDVFVA